jgi:hypothetical protein
VRVGGAALQRERTATRAIQRYGPERIAVV